MGCEGSFFAKKVHKKKLLFLTTQKFFSSRRREERKEKRDSLSLSLSLRVRVCVALFSRLAGFLRRQQRALIIVVSFESEESSFFCRSSEENRSHLLGREREKKKDFRLGKHVLLRSSRQSGEDFVDRIRREGGLWRHVFQVWYRNVRGDDHGGGRLRPISGREKSSLSDGKKSWRQKVIERRRKRKRHASTL